MGTKVYDNALDLITFSRNSGGTYLDSNGVLQLASADIPRIDYSPDGTAKGLLIEEQRTNLVTYSEDFTQWSVTRLESVTEVADGFKIEQQSGQSTGGGVYIPDPGDRVSLYAVSFEAKAAEKSFLAIYHKALRTYFNLSTGQVGTVGAGASAYIEDVGEGWYRCTVVDQSVNNNIVAYVADADGSTVVTDSGGIFIRRAQYEQGTFPTSYIPTSGSTVTRAADVASIPVSAFGYNQKEFSLYTFFTALGYDDTHYVLTFSDGTSANRLGLYQNVGSGKLELFNSYSGANDVRIVEGAESMTSGSAIAYAAKTNDFSFYINGALVGSDTSGTLSENIDVLHIGSQTGALIQSGHIKSIQYFPRRLTNAQLQELTT